MDKTINVQDFLPAIIATRKAINIFEQDMQFTADASYVFDFANIFFISRAFADEFFKFLIKNNIEFKFKNANSNILEIFNAVQKNRRGKPSSYHEIAVTSFRKKKDLAQFLSLIWIFRIFTPDFHLPHQKLSINWLNNTFILRSKGVCLFHIIDEYRPSDRDGQ